MIIILKWRKGPGAFGSGPYRGCFFNHQIPLVRLGRTAQELHGLGCLCWEQAALSPPPQKTCFSSAPAVVTYTVFPTRAQEVREYW